MSVPNDIPLPADVNATIIPLSLVGERYVQLFPAWKAGQPKLKPNVGHPAGAHQRAGRTRRRPRRAQALARLDRSRTPPGELDQQPRRRPRRHRRGPQRRTRRVSARSPRRSASKSAQVASIIDHFDRLTATLATRDQTLGRVLDAFATTTDALADERVAIQSLLASLSSLATQRPRPRVRAPRASSTTTSPS